MLVICQACRVRDTDRDDMMKIKNLYYHKGECYDKVVAHAEFKRRDNEEKDYLNEVILDVHNIKTGILPKVFWSNKIQALRNGEPFKHKGSFKKYKEGFTYKEIAETYKRFRKKIRDGINRIENSKKPFDGNIDRLNYGFAIVVDKIQTIRRNMERRERQRISDEIREKHIEENQKEFEKNIEREVSFKKKEKDDSRVADISQFL